MQKPLLKRPYAGLSLTTETLYALALKLRMIKGTSMICLQQ